MSLYYTIFFVSSGAQIFFSILRDGPVQHHHRKIISTHRNKHQTKTQMETTGKAKKGARRRLTLDCSPSDQSSIFLRSLQVSVTMPVGTVTVTEKG
ncbi:hypothetical protein HanIR_Chr15g0762091 [Helianthus annuus]|nr:hypothetical protein HanIR_Chr15g0762091 [Helianthus annuus]